MDCTNNGYTWGVGPSLVRDYVDVLIEKENYPYQIFCDNENIIQVCNNNKVGVECCNLNTDLYWTNIRGKRWYFCIISYCLNLIIQNVWQLHKMQHGKLYHSKFRRQIALPPLETLDFVGRDEDRHLWKTLIQDLTKLITLHHPTKSSTFLAFLFT